MKGVLGVDLMYIAEIVPAADSSAEILEPDINIYEDKEYSDDVEKAPLVNKMLRTTFTGLYNGVGYSFNIRTVVNGRLICQQVQQRTTFLQNDESIFEENALD